MLAVIIAGLDPVSEAYPWLSGAATLGLVSLMTLASIAVVVFFRVHDHDKRIWHTIAAPSLAAFGLAAVLALVVANFTRLIPSTVSAWVVGLLVVASFVAGVVVALRLRTADPTTYEALFDE